MALSKGASEVLMQDIRGIESELAQIDVQAQQIETRREALNCKLELLRSAIGVDAHGSAPPAPADSQVGNGATKFPDSHVVATGFRASIRAVFKDAPKGLRPRDVYDELLRRGVPYAGKTDPVIRTSTEMWRMQKVGQLRKRGQLYYPQETAQ